jgi:hypothetical protein
MLEVNKNGPVFAGTLRLRGTDLPTETKDIEQIKLQFYPDNPRIYSLVQSDGQTPTQDEIYQRLLKEEHVRTLIHDISDNGGLIDPLIVRDKDLVVLEGNSRLAAYRHLASKDPIKWAKVRCTVLPANIDDKLVFALLGQYHVKGKKDWVPYEKAGFLYRRHKQQKIGLSIIATELGIPQSEAKHLVNVYEFMLDHDDYDRGHWSFYDEYLKSTKIKKARDEYANFDAFIVSEIKTGGIPKAMDLRDKLPIICTGPAKILKRYSEGKITFADAYEDAVDAGGDNHALKRLKKFREWLVRNETEEDLLDCNKTIRDKNLFELKEIEKRSKKLKSLLENKKSHLHG